MILLAEVKWSISASLSDSTTRSLQKISEYRQKRSLSFSLLRVSISLRKYVLCRQTYFWQFTQPPSCRIFPSVVYHISETLLKTWYWEISSNLRSLHHPNLTPNQRPNECCFWPVLSCWRYYIHCVWLCQAPAASWGPPGWEALIERVWEGG